MLKKIKKSIAPFYHKFKNRVEYIINQIFGHTNYKKIVIVSRSRTGSTLLMALLNNHSNIICEGEIFKNLNSKSCKEIWQSLFNKKSRKIKAVGFKLFYYHPFDEDKSVWDLILNDEQINIIHLTRENLLRAYASQRIGEKTKQWTENINRPHNIDVSVKHIELDFKECLETFETISSYEEKTRQFFNNKKIMEVTYEDLSTDYMLVIEKILKKINLPIEKLTTVMKKQNPEPLNRLILNYEELKNQFKDSKWIYMFDS